MTHRTLNGLIAGLAVFYGSLIIAGILFGSGGTFAGEDGDPESGGVATENRTSFTDASSEDRNGVGGVAAEDWTATGIVMDQETGEPLSGVSVVAEDDGSEQVATTTGDDGHFVLEDIPATAMIVFSLDGYHTVDKPANANGEYSVSLEPAPITRRVVSADGSPLQGATISRGEHYARTGDGGEFRPDDLTGDGDIIAKAAGHETQIIAWEEFDRGFTLMPKLTRGIYANADTVANEQRLSEILRMFDRTELNTLIVDIKDDSGQIHYDSQVPLARETDAVRATYDAGELVQRVRDRDIYLVARIAVFADPALAEARPELAIQDSETGEPWAADDEGRWANPYQTEVWDYNLQIVQEAVNLGFDEIQLSFVQFPDEGTLERAEFGQPSTAESRQQAINEFLDRAYDVVGPTAASLSADVDAMTLWDETIEETGQSLIAMAERLDYVHPILFPFSFESGSLNYNTPANHPGEMVSRSLESGMDLLPAHLHARIRPWLQDFYPGSGPRYAEPEVRAQIDAANGRGVSGWMLWNPENYYHEAALEREE